MTPSARLAHYLPLLRTVQPIRSRGTVCRVRGLLIVGQGPAAALGDVCEIYPRCRNVPVRAEVVGFAQHEIMLMPLGELRGIRPGSPILHRGERAAVPVGPALQGRVLDGLGQPLDERGPLAAETTYPLYAQPLHPLRRARISEPLDLGVRAINALLTCGKGQRLGIFAGSGVGKSALLGMIARATQADINVIALIGERGREVREFLERDLGPAGQQRSVVVVATAEQPPLVRLRAAFVATAIAEFFRDRGQDVLLMMDSLTRVAMAQREIGLAVGEPPTSRGYTPSVFTLLPQLLERAGMGAGQGSITGLYTVLIEGDDFHDPIGDAVRATVDGHLLLSRALAAQGHYPAIDVPLSLSRVMPDITTAEHQRLAAMVRELLAVYQDAEDLLHIGAYVQGSNRRLDQAVKMIDAIRSFLRQPLDVSVSLADSLAQLRALCAPLEGEQAQGSGRA